MVLVSHLGYGVGRRGVVLALPTVDAGTAGIAVTAGAAVTADSATVTGGQEGAPAVAVPLLVGPLAPVPGWTGGQYARIDLPDDLGTGSYRVDVVLTDGTTVSSEAFEIAPDLMQRLTMSDILSYFKAMRSSGEIDRKDRAAKHWGDPDGPTVDARGGWLDASGDTSKFLSHLTYTTLMAPQQIPLCVWSMAASRDAVARSHPALDRSLSARLRDEALWGADFLVRFRSPDGFFYTGIFDALTKQLDERVITAPLPDCVRTDRYQAAYRQGGGVAIAALARASRFDDDGDFSREMYLETALAAFEHLEAHNAEYLDDATENVQDDYCALLAATELAGALIERHEPADGGVGDPVGDAVSDAVGGAAAVDDRLAGIVAAAESRAASLAGRYTDEGYGPGWFVGDAAGRPFFHAVEAGLPIVALLRFAEVLPASSDAAKARGVAVRAMLDHVDRAAAVHNPFGYPRQRVQPKDESPRDAFFFPHANETGYWWQGENATISSLSVAASEVGRLAEASELSPEDRDRLRAYADDQLAWVLGRNPFDASMLQGRGRGNVDYASDFPNLPGGIVNGITAGWTDERDIAFLPADADEGDSWRWAEQWIPHTGWFLLAVASAR
ncbi:glycoside hydrolase family 9 protein [Plantibacter sp. YIM 135249]|uniref:glycoside hydrolase family 9 protein n=1 Tax=Plantibacter sp. YIM 135249 TaxID=3423918 RepID=UPI003D328BE2